MTSASETEKRLINLIKCMNSTHSEELGDFLCLREEGRIERIITNDTLRDILLSIVAICENDTKASPTLIIDLSKHKLFQENICIALKSFLREKTGVDIMPQQDYDEIFKMTFVAIGSMISSLPKMVRVRLNLSRCYLGDAFATEASEVFKGLPSLIELDMSYNQIGREGANTIFTTLLGHPSCKIESLNLEQNWSITASSALTLIEALPRQESLTSLNLAGTGIVPSAGMMRVFYDFSEHHDDGNSLFDIPKTYNNHLRHLKLGSSGSATTEKLFVEALKMNEGSPEEAVARKVDHYLKKNRTEIYEATNKDTDLVFQTLEFVGKHGSLTSLLRLVKDFLVNGSLAISTQSTGHKKLKLCQEYTS